MLRPVTRGISSVPVGKTPGQLGVWLAQELTRRGYDLAKGGQSRFAREADLHPSIVNRILSEDRGAEVDVLRRMGNALGYTLGEMLLHAGLAGRDELPVRTPDELDLVSNNPFTDPHERQIWEMGELSDSVRHHLVIALRAALQLEQEEDRRPNADVRPLRRHS